MKPYKTYYTIWFKANHITIQDLEKEIAKNRLDVLYFTSKPILYPFFSVKVQRNHIGRITRLFERLKVSLSKRPF